ncbi:MAG: hypothetical protein P8Z76_19290 [Alphaproteobacteria bacterium]
MRQEVLNEAGTDDAETVTRKLVNRLLHEPSSALRAIAADDGEAQANQTASLLGRLFGIGGSGGGAKKPKMKKGPTT